MNTHSFQPCKAGLYWFLLDICSDASGIMNYTMCDVTAGGKCTGIYATTKMSVSSQNELRFVHPQNQLQMFSQYRQNKRKNMSYGMVWGGFNIELISTDPPIAFSVVKQSGVVGTTFAQCADITKMFNSTFLLEFDVVLVNSGHGWNETTHTFTAPVSGIYILNFSILTEYYEEIYLSICNFTAQNSTACIVSIYEKDLKTVTCSLVVELRRSDSANLVQWTEDHYQQVSFRGFLYSPSSHVSIVWSAISRNFHLTNAQNDIHFDILVNIGKVFTSNDTSKVIIPINGIYYIIFRTHFKPDDSAIALFVNGAKSIEITTNSELHSNLSLERCILLQLAAGTSLSWQWTRSTSIALNEDHLMFVYIAGFLVTYF